MEVVPGGVSPLIVSPSDRAELTVLLVSYLDNHDVLQQVFSFSLLLSFFFSTCDTPKITMCTGGTLVVAVGAEKLKVAAHEGRSRPLQLSRELEQNARNLGGEEEEEGKVTIEQARFDPTLGRFPLWELSRCLGARERPLGVTTTCTAPPLHHMDASNLQDLPDAFIYT